jgi:predicted transglutaminase-like cysteine proteinase
VRKVAAAALLLVALAAGMAPGSARAAGTFLFGTAEAVAQLDDAPAQWWRALREIAREAPVVDACRRARGRCPNPGTSDWLQLLGSLAGAPELEQVRAVHGFVNRWAYRSDLPNHGRSDLWAAPVEFFARSGDCEDYAIAKYVSLRRLGFAPERLRLVVLEDTARGIAHAVLAVYLGGEIWILDNLADEPLPQARLPHYVPYYSLNEAGRWVHAPLRRPAIAAADHP